ncbi:MAG: hypothetical protein OEV81_08425 [Betaproteobacteria bacterium]|nr:hypothetical protein [Betaproteobacteria bacterium]MDH5221262.1 hypothetical protein [Betaproteobacteria bacterium]MDH5349485.1 hypothetical protein [Betaproteobacteria bacterium]
MHCELMLAGALAAEARLPALELLLARGRATRADPQGAAAWLGRACGLDPVPAGALTAGEAGFRLRADPVHYRVLRDRVVIVPATALDARAADALVGTLNRHFAGRHEFRAATPDAWTMSSAPAPIDAPPAAEVWGRDFAECMPAAPWPALLNEIQMALHDHPANEGREAAANGVWLWGAGELPAALRAPWRSIASDDPLARGLARAAGIESHAAPRAAAEWLAALPGAGRHLVQLGALEGAMDEAWFAPLLEALRAGRLGMLTLHAPGAGLAVEAARHDLRRFWRRARPLESHAHR